MDFIEHTGSFFDDSAPGEEDLINYFKFIRTERKMASSLMWVLWSCKCSSEESLWDQVAGISSYYYTAKELQH